MNAAAIAAEIDRAAQNEPRAVVMLSLSELDRLAALLPFETIGENTPDDAIANKLNTMRERLLANAAANVPALAFANKVDDLAEFIRGAIMASDTPLECFLDEGGSGAHALAEDVLAYLGVGA